MTDTTLEDLAASLMASQLKTLRMLGHDKAVVGGETQSLRELGLAEFHPDCRPMRTWHRITRRGRAVLAIGENT